MMTWQEYLSEPLAKIDAALEKELYWGKVKIQALLPIHDAVDWCFCPAVIFELGRLWGYTEDELLDLALLIEYTYLGFSIHRMVKGGETDESVRQYAVLLGDYFYGRAFAKLCGDKFQYLNDFIQSMKEMNEGFLLRWRLRKKSAVLQGEELRDVLCREKTALPLLALNILLERADVTQEDRVKLNLFVRETGLLWAARGEAGKKTIWRESVEQIEQLLSNWQTSLPLDEFRRFYDRVFADSQGEHDLVFFRETC